MAMSLAGRSFSILNLNMITIDILLIDVTAQILVQKPFLTKYNRNTSVNYIPHLGFTHIPTLALQFP